MNKTISSHFVLETSTWTPWTASLGCSCQLKHYHELDQLKCKHHTLFVNVRRAMEILHIGNLVHHNSQL